MLRPVVRYLQLSEPKPNDFLHDFIQNPSKMPKGLIRFASELEPTPMDIRSSTASRFAWIETKTSDPLSIVTAVLRTTPYLRWQRS